MSRRAKRWAVCWEAIKRVPSGFASLDAYGGSGRPWWVKEPLRNLHRIDLFFIVSLPFLYLSHTCDNLLLTVSSSIPYDNTTNYCIRFTFSSRGYHLC